MPTLPFHICRNACTAACRAQRSTLGLIFFCALAQSFPVFAEEECQIAVMTLRPLGLSQADQHIPEVLTDTLADALSDRKDCQIVTQADIAQMMDFEAMKATCAVDSPSCIAEIGGALGVSRVVNGSVASLGGSFKLQVKMHNVSTAVVEERFNRLVSGDAVALDQTAREAASVLLAVIPQNQNDVAQPTPVVTNEAAAPNEPSPSAAGSDQPAAVASSSQRAQTDAADSQPPPQSPEAPPASESAQSDDTGWAMGTGLMVAGGGILAVSAVALLASAGTAGGLEFAINTGAIKGNDRDTARYAGLAALAVSALGTVGVLAGAGVTGVSFFVE